MLNDSHATHYSPHEYITVDEITVLFKGRVICDQYILKKHKRLGIRIIQVIKSRRRWDGHITHMGEERSREDFWWENLRERDDIRPRHRWDDNIKNES